MGNDQKAVGKAEMLALKEAMMRIELPTQHDSRLVVRTVKMNELLRSAWHSVHDRK